VAPEALVTTLSYTTLTTALSLPNTQALESLITTAIYSNLLLAHLDPLHQTVRVTSVAPLRDLAPGSIPAMDALLEQWSGRCTTTLTGIEAQIAGIRRRAYDERARQERDESVFAEQLAKVEERKEKDGKGQGQGKQGGMAGRWGNILGGKRSAAGQEDLMEVDEGMGGGSGVGGNRSSKRKGAGGRG